MKLAAPLALAALTLAAPRGADAGALGQATRSIASKQAESRSESGSSAPTRTPPSRPDSYEPAGDDASYVGTYPYYAPAAGCCYPRVSGGAGGRGRPPVHVALSATYENVVDSDGSLNLGIRLSSGALGLGFASSSYFESDRLGKGEPETQSRLTLWDASVQGRLLRVGEATELWITGGLTGLHSNQFETTFGGSLGGELRHRFAEALRVEGGVRGMIYGDDIKASELRAGVTASVLHVGYRYLRFNVGPALRGPEVGLALDF